LNSKANGKRKAGYNHITRSNCLKGVSGKVVVDEKGIKDSWKEYIEKLINDENEWDHSGSITLLSSSINYLLLFHSMDTMASVLSN